MLIREAYNHFFTVRGRATSFERLEMAESLGEQTSNDPTDQSATAGGDEIASIKVHQSGDERRGEDRREYYVGVHFGDEQLDRLGMSTDISQGGIFVAAHDPLEVGTRVELEIFLADREESLTLEGVVRWRREQRDDDSELEAGFGVEFEGLDETSSTRLEDLIEALDSQ